jgi:hypothetical protein
MARVEGSSSDAEPRRRRERSRSIEESEVGESTSSSIGLEIGILFFRWRSHEGSITEQAYWTEGVRTALTRVGKSVYVHLDALRRALSNYKTNCISRD